MSEVYDKLLKCYKQIREKTDFEPKVALVLGSGLGKFAEEIKVEGKIAYSELDGFPVSTVIGHKGQFVYGYLGSTPIICMQGRYYRRCIAYKTYGNDGGQVFNAY